MADLPVTPLQHPESPVCTCSSGRTPRARSWCPGTLPNRSAGGTADVTRRFGTGDSPLRVHPTDLGAGQGSPLRTPPAAPALTTPSPAPSRTRPTKSVLSNGDVRGCAWPRSTAHDPAFTSRPATTRARSATGSPTATWPASSPARVSQRRRRSDAGRSSAPTPGTTTIASCSPGPNVAPGPRLLDLLRQRADQPVFARPSQVNCRCSCPGSTGCVPVVGTLLTEATAWRTYGRWWRTRPAALPRKVKREDAWPSQAHFVHGPLPCGYGSGDQQAEGPEVPCGIRDAVPHNPAQLLGR